MHSPLLRTKKGWFALAAVAIVPLLYSGSYLSAFWNPYGHLNSLPIAIVNQDQGYHGHQEGRQVIHMLPKDLHTRIFTSGQNVHAQKLLKSGKVDMVIDIPKNFSRDLFHQHTPTISYATDPGTNYLTGILMDREAVSLTQSMVHHIQSHITHREFAGMTRLQQDSWKLHEAAATLSQKSQALKPGGITLSQDLKAAATASRQLSQNTQQLASQYHLFASNVQAYVLSQDKVNHNMNILSQKAGDFHQGILQEQQAISALASYANKLANQSTSLTSASSSLTQATTQLQGNEERQGQLLQEAITLAHKSPNNPSTQKELQQVLGRMQAHQVPIQNLSQHINQGATELTHNLQAFTQASSQLAASTQVLDQHAASLTASSSAFDTSIIELQQASAQITEAAQKIDSGAQQLTEPLASLAQGQNTASRSLGNLSSHLTQYTNSVNLITQPLSLFSSHLTQLSKDLGKAKNPLSVLASPLKTHHMNVGPQGNYGTGLSPYFVGLSLWVGALVVTVLVPGGKKDGLKTRQWLSLGLSAAQFLVLTAGILILLPLHPTHLVVFWLVLAAISLSWWAIMRFLVEKFGDGGRLLAIVLLVVQLSGSAGTYPIALSPRFFALIHPYLPMTWAIHVMRYALSGSYQSVLVPDLIRLLATALVCWLLTQFLPARLAFDAPSLESPKTLS